MLLEILYVSSQVVSYVSVLRLESYCNCVYRALLLVRSSGVAGENTYEAHSYRSGALLDPLGHGSSW